MVYVIGFIIDPVTSSIEKAHGPLKARLTKVLLEYHNGKLPNDLAECNKILNKVISAKNHEKHYATSTVPFTVSQCSFLFSFTDSASYFIKKLIYSFTFLKFDQQM